MPHYKFTYFDLHALGEPIKLLFVVSKVDFEDVRIPFHKWGELKPVTGHGKLPVLHVDGEQFTQSLAICRYLAKQFNLIPKTDIGNYRAEELVELFMDLRLDFFVPFLLEADPKKKAELKENLVNNIYPKYYGIFESLIKKTEGTFISGEGENMSWADIFLASWIHTSTNLVVPPEFVKAYPALNKLYQTVFQNEEIRKYYKL